MTKALMNQKTLVFGKNPSHISVQQSTQEIPKLTNKRSVLVKVHAVGLNPVDAKLVVGDKIPSTWKRTRSLFHSLAVHNTPIGFDFAGTVQQSFCSDYKPGDEVYGSVPPLYGTLREYVVAPIHQISHKPSSLSWSEAAAMPLVGLTALQALKPHASDTILVLGASSGTGHIALQVAQRLGFSTRIAVCSKRNLEWVRQHCRPTHIIDYTTEDVVASVQSILSTGGKQLDVVFDCVTSEDPRDMTANYPAMFVDQCQERYIRLGGQLGDWVRAGFERSGRLTCFGKEKLFWIRFPHSSGELRQLQEWSDDEGPAVRPRIAEEVEFSREAVQQAMEKLLSRAVTGKIVVKVIPHE